MEGQQGYAGFVSRAIAFTIDSSIVVVLCTVGFQVTSAILSTIDVTDIDAGDSAKALGFVLVVPATFWLYCTVLWSLGGRTIGMMALGLRVVQADGAPPGIRRSVIRALGYWVSAIAMLGFAWIAIDRRSQGFHDKLAGTFVVYDWATLGAPAA
jgi:uncharacterized RDD family membrane protein YckC